MKPVLVYSTTPTRAEALSIADHLVAEKLAACVQVMAAVISLYAWEGNREQSEEYPLLVKTTDAKADAVIARIKALHSYECPGIIAIPVSGGHPAFLQWIASEVES